jgi:ATP-dependent helicase/nuclease subunit A
MSALTEKQEQASDLDRSLVVTAGAGSGKTKVLVERYIRVLISDPSLGPKNILALTFTEKAASEMKAKVREALLREVSSDKERFEPLLSDLEAADISTIHSFCTHMIRTEPLRLGLDPGFEVLSEARAATMLQAALSTVFVRPGPESASLRRLIVDYGSSRTRENVTGMVRDRARSKVDPGSSEFRTLSMTYLESCSRDLRDRAMSAYPAFVKAIEGLKGLPPPKGEDASTKLVSLLSMVDFSDPDTMFSSLGRVLSDLLTGGGKKRSVSRLGSTKTWGGAIDAMRRNVSTIVDLAYENRQHLRYVSTPDMRERAERALNDLITVFQAVDRRYTEMKIKAASLDFDDMVNLALRILNEDQEGLRTRLRSQFRHIMVDEFQDTDPRQWDLVRALWDHASGSKLFLVGDPKQSIYGFRSSDVRLFASALKGMEQEGTGDSVVLDLNFRSRSEIMAFVNAIFPSIMCGDDQWGVPFEPLQPHKGGGGTITLIAVEGKKECDQREGLEVAKTVKRAIREQWPIIDKDTGQERSARYEDMAVLFRGRTALEHYERAFRTERVPFVVYKGKGFYDRQEVSDILRMLQWLCTPTDDVALSSVLKGPFFFLTDSDLLRSSASPSSRAISLQERLRSDPSKDSIVQRLDRYLALARTLPVHIAIPRIIAESDLYACLGGKRECRNIDRALEMFAGSEGRSIFEVRDELSELVEQGSREGEPPLSAEKAVTMMTIHAAKGLEWPMVFVVGMHHENKVGEGATIRIDPDGGASIKVFDPSCGEMVETPSYVVSGECSEEREAQEEKRLFYVACTRAKDHLVLSGRIPSPEDNVPGQPPQGFMKLLLEPLGISFEDFDRGSIDVGGVEVKLVPVRSALAPEDEVQAKDVELVSEDYPLSEPIKGGITPETVNPSGEREVWAHSFPPSGRLSTPDQFGTMVHEVLMGRDPRRVAVENGFPEEEAIVKDMAERIFSLLPKEGIEGVFNEISVLGRDGESQVVGRIDRLLKMKDGSYIVIDFKTGSRSDPHEKQVRTYMDAVERMTGAMVEGMIAYPDGIVRFCRETTSKCI